MRDFIFLTGSTGTGKSTIGKKLSKKLGWKLIDSDQAIQKQAGKTISTIFEEDGEEVFRNYETEFLKSLDELEDGRYIIATGGGMVVREENRRLMHEKGMVVWVDSSLKSLIERLSKSTDRPLLQNTDLREKLIEMRKQRNPYYAQCDLKVVNKHIPNTVHYLSKKIKNAFEN